MSKPLLVLYEILIVSKQSIFPTPLLPAVFRRYRTLTVKASLDQKKFLIRIYNKNGCEVNHLGFFVEEFVN